MQVSLAPLLHMPGSFPCHLQVEVRQDLIFAGGEETCALIAGIPVTELVEGEDSDRDSDATARTSSGESLGALEAVFEAEHAAEVGTDALGMPLLAASAEDSAPLSECKTAQSNITCAEVFELKPLMGPMWLICSLQFQSMPDIAQHVKVHHGRIT